MEVDSEVCVEEQAMSVEEQAMSVEEQAMSVEEPAMSADFEYETKYDEETKTWSGCKPDPVCELSFGQIAFEAMSKRKEKLFQCSDGGGEKLTYGEVLEQAIQIAKHLKAALVRQDHVVGIIGRHTRYLAALVLACCFNGTPFHAIDPHLPTDKIRDLLSISQPKYVFVDGEDEQKMGYATVGKNITLVAISDFLGKDNLSIEELLQQPSHLEEEYRPSELTLGLDHTLAILCTSGTTGPPRPVTVPNTTRIYERFKFLTEDDIQYVPNQIDSLTGFASFAASIVYGARRIISEYDYRPDDTVNVLQRNQVTFTIFSPTLMAYCVRDSDIKAEKFDSVRYFVFGGSTCPTRIIDGMAALVRKGRLICAYGFTELFDVLAINFRVADKPKSVGRLTKDFKVQIFDDDGVALGPNQIGHIHIFSGLKWQGYYEKYFCDPDHLLDKDGWYQTCDVGYFDEDNYLHINGRYEEMIQHKLDRCTTLEWYPSEIEEILARMPRVQEFCVFGIENSRQIKTLGVAAIVPVKNYVPIEAYDVVRFVERSLPKGDDHKVVRACIMHIDELPKTRTGKIDRNEVRRIYLNYY